mgnify:FL=1|jgi:release factor glutamine methyltransferase
MTYAALLKWAAHELNDAGIEGARREAELLLAYTLGIRREDLYLRNPLSEVQADAAGKAGGAASADAATATVRFQEVVARRAAREPLAYITGAKEFYGLTFAVDQRVLIPRPETELLVELCLEHLERRSGGKLSCEQHSSAGCGSQREQYSVAHAPFVVADICTGSGAVGIAVAVNRPDVSVLASDISAAALEVAAGNAQRHGVSERIVFAQGDLFAPWKSWQSSPSSPSPPNAGDGDRHLMDRAINHPTKCVMNRIVDHPMDVILCNPPYIPQYEIATLQPEVRDYEPRQALEAGADGLAFYRRLLSQAGTFLNQDGLLLMEIGYGQQDAVLRMAHENGWKASTIPDLAGIARVVAAQRV